MKMRIKYPYVLVYEGEKNRVRFVLRKRYDLTTTLDSDTVGNFLIDFILLPIADYKRRLGELAEAVPADFTVDNELVFAMYNAEIYDLSKQLQEKHYLAGFFLMGKLDQVFSEEISDADKIKMAVKVLEEVITLQEIFADGLTMCCDVEYDKEGLSPSGLFLAFTAKHQNFISYYLQTGIMVAPTKDKKVDFDAVDSVAGTNKKEQLAKTDKLKDKGANLTSYTVLEDFSDFLYYEFTELLKQGLTIRRCKNCAQYFVLKSKHQTYYCDRKQENGRTCKQIGNKKEYQKRIASDLVLQEYERLYKLHHAQMERDEQKESPTEKISRAKKEFLKWSKQAQKMRKQYMDGSIPISEFRLWLERN